MKSTSKLVMGVTLAMVVSLAIVLALVLVLLAELYCSLLLRRRRLRTATNATSTPHQSSQQESSSAPPPLNRIYAHGVLHAPRRFLFPAFVGKEEVEEEKEEKCKQFPLPYQSGLHQVEGEIISTPRRIGLITASSPSLSIKSLASPRSIQAAAEGNGGGGAGEHFVYISNPIYDNDACKVNRVGVGTPFETPETSPSRLEMSSDDDEEVEEEDAEVEEPSSSSPKSLPMTPPLTPMKKLPVEACSVSLRDARSIGTSGSGSDTKNCSSSSSSGSPRTSPSW
ncbi:uncharacterized protein LOC122651073 [Telopea speciosissima]|uniref:uncharacterized protein LOC122651073 n=1 Tax=Telopea speciosissima TaxID=54955 RepID=UPI001CC6D130|nr:uncharacterized protein LOC122651073 [Telopea speciosissima]